MTSSHQPQKSVARVGSNTQTEDTVNEPSTTLHCNGHKSFILVVCAMRQTLRWLVWAHTRLVGMVKSVEWATTAGSYTGCWELL